MIKNIITDLARRVYTDPVDGSFIPLTPAEFEIKFAELIVKECAEFFEIEYGISELSGYDASHVIKKHFNL